MSKCNFYLGFCPSDDLMNGLYLLDSRPSVQTVNYGRKILSILEGQGDVVNISSAPIQDYPHCNKIFVTSDVSSDKRNIFIPFINLLGFKQVFRFVISLFFLIFNRKSKKNSTIFLHGVHLPFILSAVISRLVGYKVVLYATDPPGVIISSDGTVRRFLKNIDKYVIDFLLSHIDGVVVPSKEFINAYNFRKGIPYEVIPGIMDSIDSDTPVIFTDLTKKDIISVCYSGSIYKNNGIENLVYASRYLPPNVRVHIIGGGEDFDFVKSLSCEFDRVILHGFKSGREYMDLISDMDILVNVRPPAQDFTKFSFPSKLFEYLKLRKVIITTRLPSIPEEISECFNYFNSIKPEDISNEICSVIRKNKYKSIEDNFDCAYAHYSVDGVSLKIRRLKRNL